VRVGGRASRPSTHGLICILCCRDGGCLLNNSPIGAGSCFGALRSGGDILFVQDRSVFVDVILKRAEVRRQDFDEISAVARGVSI
jgi:hypothetical protein